MKGYKQIFVIAAVGIFIAPQIAFAAWWNPISWSFWNIFRPAPKVQQVQIDTKAQATTTTAGATTTSTKTKDASDSKDSLINSLRKQVSDLKQKTEQPKVEAPKTSIITLPNGSVVEMDANGNIIRTIKDAPQQTYSAPAPVAQDQTQSISTQQLGSALSNLYAQSVLNFIKTAAPHLATYAGLEQAKYAILPQGRQQCEQTYSHSYCTAYGGILQDSTTKCVQQEQQDKNDCLARYPLGDTTIPQQIDNAVNQLDTLYKRAWASPTSVSEINSLLQEYNDLEAKIYSINTAIPTLTAPVALPPISQTSPAGSFSCNWSPTGSGYSCTGSSGVSTSCSISPTGNSLGCRSSDGTNIGCRVSPTGNGISCSY